MSKRADAIRRELARIARANGGILMPSAVVEAARPESSPLHSRFEWDDGEAANAYRLWQARQLITITVSVCARTESDEQVWVSLTPDRKGDGGYRSLVAVLSDVDMRAQLLADALDDLQVFRAKYKHLQELAGVFAAIEAASAK